MCTTSNTLSLMSSQEAASCYMRMFHWDEGQVSTFACLLTNYDAVCSQKCPQSCKKNISLIWGILFPVINILNCMFCMFIHYVWHFEPHLCMKYALQIKFTCLSGPFFIQTPTAIIMFLKFSLHI